MYFSCGTVGRYTKFPASIERPLRKSCRELLGRRVSADANKKQKSYLDGTYFVTASYFMSNYFVQYWKQLKKEATLMADSGENMLTALWRTQTAITSQQLKNWLMIAHHGRLLQSNQRITNQTPPDCCPLLLPLTLLFCVSTVPLISSQ